MATDLRHRLRRSLGALGAFVINIRTYELHISTTIGILALLLSALTFHRQFFYEKNEMTISAFDIGRPFGGGWESLFYCVANTGTKEAMLVSLGHAIWDESKRDWILVRNTINTNLPKPFKPQEIQIFQLKFLELNGEYVQDISKVGIFAEAIDSNGKLIRTTFGVQKAFGITIRPDGNAGQRWTVDPRNGGKPVNLLKAGAGWTNWLAPSQFGK